MTSQIAPNPTLAQNGARGDRPSPTIQNVVATASLGCRLDLKTVALKAQNTEYNPKRFSAVIMRIRDPRCTVLLFESGKIVCTGAKSMNDAKTAAMRCARVVQHLGFQVHYGEFKLQNVVGSVDVKFPIRLEGLTMAHKEFSDFNPEIFPGLVYRMKRPKVVLLIFVSGKIVLTGAKDMESIDEAFDFIYPSLCQFRQLPPGEKA